MTPEELDRFLTTLRGHGLVPTRLKIAEYGVSDVELVGRTEDLSPGEKREQQRYESPASRAMTALGVRSNDG